MANSRRHSVAPVTTSPSRIPTSPSSSSSGIPTRLSHRTSISLLSNRNTQSPGLPFGAVDTMRPGSSMETVKRPASIPLTSTPLRRAPSREMLNKPEAESANVQVVLRIRPSYQPDQNIPARFTRTVLQPSPSNPTNEVLINLNQESNTSAVASAVHAPAGGNKGKQTSFRYDRVLGEDSLQSEVFESAGKLAVDKFISGLNVTVLAYGQTSSGKSYTMGTTGIDDDYHPSADGEVDASDRTGMIPRAMSEIFKRAEVKRKESGAGSSWECRLSFLELYNEELIDLLSTLPVAQSPPIVIREDKGRILWSGLKEVSVTTTAEVMKYLREGSTKRRTGETGMNKESSRSHAIFSLTLVQTRRTGEGNSTPGGKGRPMSTPNGPPSSLRSPTPSGIRTPNRTSLFAGRGLNGSSGRVTPSTSQVDDEASWVETSSKFHFVDLAGSERLKRTAAAGDRMKEGISINAGLLALGNVISALADPNKNKTMHIPYRDSKLTRLLQDSLGGNAFTVMIACVSPVEFNLGETLNTLKYGARARNIKNRAEVNEVEVGWDDVEHLQGAVTKLRAEVARLKAMSETGERSGTPTVVAEDVEAELRESRARLQEMEAEHDIMRDELQAKTLQVARLVTDLKATEQSGSFNPDDVSAFSKLVEPIVEEYERLIQALEGKLQATLASLELSDERAAEAKEVAAQREHRMARQETYVADLVNRLNRLKDKERTFDDYISDLEHKLQTFEDQDSTHQKTVSDLRAELSEERKQSKNAADYIATMETAISQSETDLKDFAHKVERLEAELKRKEDSHHELQERIKLVDTTEDNQLLLTELEEKNLKLAELERELEDSLFSKRTLGEERDLLRQQTAEQMEQLVVLRARVEQASTAPSNGHSHLLAKPSRPLSIAHLNDYVEDDSTEKVPGSPTTPVAVQHDAGARSPGSLSMAPEVVELQERHASTLAELATISDRYKEALEKITELTGQVVEAEKANRASPGSDPETPVSPVAMSRTVSASSIASAASNESGRSRRTTSIGNELIAKTDRTDFRSGRGDRMGDTRPVSLSQELSLSRLSRSSFGSGTSLLSPLGNNRQNLPSRSTASLEAEIKQLQEVLRRRDDEIRVLENAMRSLSGTSPRFEKAGQINMYHSPSGGPELIRGMSSSSSMASQNSLPVTPNDQQGVDPLLTPTTTRHFTILKEQTNQDAFHDEANEIDRIDRLDTLMRSMARIEVEHKQEVEELNQKLKASVQEIHVLKSSRESVSTSVDSHVTDLDRDSGVVRPGTEAVSINNLDTSPTSDRESDRIDIKELQQSLTGFQTAITDLVFDYSLAESDQAEIDTMSGINRIATALASADATEVSLRAELSQLRAQTSELGDIKLSLQAAVQEKSARDAVIQDLERKLQELHLASRRQSETSESDKEPPIAVGPRMSFGRAATPTSKIPPLQPPPSMPPPPLPPLPEGLPTSPRQAFPDGGTPIVEEQKRVSSPVSPTVLNNQKVEQDNRELRQQITDHERTIADLTRKIKATDYSLQESTATIKSLTDNLQSIRKLRLQSQEQTRERDLAESEVQRLQEELDAAQKEVVSVRSSIIIEKRSLEDRLSEERRAKEKTRRQFEERLEAVQAKHSKFRCF